MFRKFSLPLCKIIFYTMRGNLKFFAIALLLCAFASCSKETDMSPEPVDDTPKKSYTILYYGCCSGLDRAIEPLFEEVPQLDIPEHINVVGQIKWSEGYKSDYAGLADGSGDVQRFIYSHEEERVIVADFAAADYKVDAPDNLATFIKRARETAPADEYIMVFCGHGNAYNPAFDDITRGILRDDMYTSYLGIGEICEAFDIANVAENKFALTMMVCCVMNTLEYSTELIPYTNYYLASGHVTVATSKELYFLIDGIIKHGQDGEDAIVNAVKCAVDADYASMDNEHKQDTTLTKTVRIKKLNEKIKHFVNRLSVLYGEQVILGDSGMEAKYGYTSKDMDEALANSYYYLQPYLDASGDVSSWYQSSYNYDIVDVAKRLAEVTNDEALILYAKEIEETAAESILYQYRYNVDVPLYHAVTLVNKEEWEELRFEDANYCGLAFDQATGWSNLLKVNKANFKHEVK